MFDGQAEDVAPVRSPAYGRKPSSQFMLVVIVAYCVAHFIVRLFTSPVYTLDEADILLTGQSFQLGYDLGHAPLLSWIYAFFDLVGVVNRPVVFGVKYALMAIGLIAFYRSVQIVFEWMDDSGIVYHRLDLAAGATIAWSFVFATGWGWHEDQISQVLTFTLLASTFYAYVSALTGQGLLKWALFGGLAGLGVLSHFGFVLAPLSLVLVGACMKSLTQAHYDQNGDRLSPPAITGIRVLVAVFCLIGVISPYIAWLIMSPEASIGYLSSTISEVQSIFANQDAMLNAIQHRLDMIGLALSAIVQFSLPLSVIFIMLFWPMWFPYIYPFFPRRDVEEGPFERAWRRLFSNTLLVSCALAITYAMVSGEKLRPEWLHPVLFALPIWLFFQVQRSGPYFIAMRAFGVLSCILALLVVGGRMVDWSEDIISCQPQRCRAYMPVASWANSLKNEEGFTRGTLVTDDSHLGGNFSALFPEARVIAATYPSSAFPNANEDTSSCLVVWRDRPQLPDDLADYLQEQLKVTVGTRAPEGAMRRFLLRSNETSAVLYYRFFRPTAQCR